MPESTTEWIASLSMALALPPGGKIVCLDISEEFTAIAKRYWREAGVADCIELRLGKGVESIAKVGATFLTVHAYPQTMRAALDARQGSALKILAVTILTSWNDADVKAAGYEGGVSDQVKRRATAARDLRIDGLVCSAEESAMLRPLIGADILLVTPGIRPAGAASGDQKRVMTPAAAIAGQVDRRSRSFPFGYSTGRRQMPDCERVNARSA